MVRGLIFITGATGFIGSHVVDQTLHAGYNVRLSVRKESQIDTLRSLFSAHASKLDFVVIPDITKPDAFNQALHGVQYIFHIASPMPGKGSDFKSDYAAPAVQGTTSLLEAAKAFPAIERVVVVSSLLALIPLGSLFDPNLHAKEGSSQTINVDPDMPFPEDPKISSGLKYQASKILAHKASLDWVQTQKPHFTIITLHPSFVFGRSLTQTSANALEGSNAMLWASLFSEKPVIPMSAVDVRDVAAAHLKALDADVSREGALVEVLLSASSKEGWTWDKVASFVNEKYPELDINMTGPYSGEPKMETETAEKVLGIRWRGMEDTISSFLDQQVELRGKL